MRALASEGYYRLDMLFSCRSLTVFPFPLTTAEWIRDYFFNRHITANCSLRLFVFFGCDTKGDTDGEEDGGDQDGDGEGDEDGDGDEMGREMEMGRGGR